MKSLYYWLLLLFGLLAVCFVPLAMPHGGITSDTVYYFRIAEEIPEVSWSLFPWGYPLLLKFSHIFANEWFWAGRLTSVVIYVAIVLFSYVKKFHFKETVILLMAKIFFYSFFNSISEGLFLALMYFQFYYFYEYFEGKRRSWRFYLPAALLMALMFSVRYSALYLLVGMGAFYLFWFYKNRGRLHFIRNDFFYFIVWSAVGVGFYMTFNYVNYGDFVGEAYRNAPPESIGDNFLRNVLSVFNSFNPVLGVKLQGDSYLTYSTEAVFFIINIIVIVVAVKIWRNYFKTHTGTFHKMLIVVGLVYTLLLFASFYRQGIEELNIRMLAASTLCYTYSLVFICFKEIKSRKTLLAVAAFSLLFNSLYVLKTPEDFLRRKQEIEQVYSEMPGRKYFYIDDTDVVRVESYTIPFIHKEIKYEHGNMQDAMLNGNILMAKDPKVIWILSDTVRDKTRVVYSSQLRLKREAAKAGK